MTIHNRSMTTPRPGPLGPADLAKLADKITALTPGIVDRLEYMAGYYHAVIDASAEVMDVYHRASAAAVDAPGDDAPADDLAEVAADLLRLAVRLDMADGADIQRRMDALGGDDK